MISDRESLSASCALTHHWQKGCFMKGGNAGCLETYFLPPPCDSWPEGYATNRQPQNEIKICYGLSFRMVRFRVQSALAITIPIPYGAYLNSKMHALSLRYRTRTTKTRTLPAKPCQAAPSDHPDRSEHFRIEVSCSSRLRSKSLTLA